MPVEVELNGEFYDMMDAETIRRIEDGIGDNVRIGFIFRNGTVVKSI